MTAMAQTFEYKHSKTVRVRLRKWTRAEYDCMVAQGILTERDKVELIEGEIIEKMPQNPPHSDSIMYATSALAKLISKTVFMRVQLPLAVGDASEPEPDFAFVVRENSAAGHPTTALLVIEVADSSLVFDRSRKLPMYAKAGIQDYWIININERLVEVYRDPIKVNGRGRYQTVLTLGEEEAVAPLAFPDVRIAVNDLLP